MRYLTAAMLIIVSIIHLMPVSGVLGSERLASLYGVSLSDPTVVMLMKHRAVLFGIVGGLLLFAAFRPALQPAAFCVGLVSVVSFLMLARPSGAYTAAIERVFAADIVALIALVIGMGAWLYSYARQ